MAPSPLISQKQLGSFITHGHTAFFHTMSCPHNCISLHCAVSCQIYWCIIAVHCTASMLASKTIGVTPHYTTLYLKLVATLIGVALNLAPPLQYNQRTAGKLLYQSQSLIMNIIILWPVASGPLVGHSTHNALCNKCLVLAVNDQEQSYKNLYS